MWSIAAVMPISTSCGGTEAEPGCGGMHTRSVFSDESREALVAAVTGAQSLDDMVRWLRSQPGVRSVAVAPYLLKSEPPQRDLLVEFETGENSTATKILNVFELGGGRYQFNALREK